MLYNILQTRSQHNPYFLLRGLSYKIQAKKKKNETIQPEIGQSSEPKVPLASRRKMLLAARSEARGIERLKKRQFYHSKTFQPMSFEQVMSDADSETEVDDEFADIEERMRLNQLTKVSDEEKDLCSFGTHLVIAYGHVPWACEEFTKLHEKELIGTQAFWQWRLFMVKLWKHGLVCGKTIDECNTLLQNAQAAAASSSTSQATTNCNEKQPMEVDEDKQ
ncbi:hypothetical protein EUTSA_v10017609mg [Eutrema salsugineum]|uniref:Polycomb protein VEFS-Box domain-containing protein n=1 Tax=Eutrema salsugineum TaxID=72664 RepID=V4M7B6_EUTSA|nr:hypothetical protein EUTSA_v10017609mg [Eutrema salsugineum]